ncbi:hypothetical protein [Enterococcus sp. LJL51]|uniref:hypothetical protein n=1 Tax=Enterococcus sp. LJL51 TaxID=3416656 RepID=UPI003CF47ABF
MKIKAIRYPTTLDKIKDITNDNIDVFVDLEDGFTYTVIVSTVKSIENLLGKKGFSTPGWPQQLIIVKELKEELIKKALEAYAEADSYWLKVAFLATDFDNAYMMDKLKEMKKENEEIENISNEFAR